MIKLYRDDEANSIFVEDSNGAQFPNSLQAIKNTDNTISIVDLAKSIEIDSLPIVKGVVRAECIYAGWVFEILEENLTRAIYIN